MITVQGEVNIKATVICDSISEEGIRLLTFEIEHPRIIHSELMTHSMLARNAASSRAIPFAKMQEQLNGIPVRFGKNVSGMQDGGEFEGFVTLPVEVEWDEAIDSGLFQYAMAGFSPKDAWEEAKSSAIMYSKAFADAGYHKQVFNRLTEPFQMMRTVITGTEWANFFWLRDDESADPTIRELARCMREAMEASTPQELKAGEWHLPYISLSNFIDGVGYYLDAAEIGGEVTVLNIEQAIKVSAARCAAVSFRNSDYTLEKSLEIYDRLVGAERKHASAFGHQATPMRNGNTGFHDPADRVNVSYDPLTWEAGISHVDRDGQLWSAMLRGWVQYRKLIPNENYTG